MFIDKVLSMATDKLLNNKSKYFDFNFFTFKRKFFNQHVGWTKNNEFKAPESKNHKKIYPRGVEGPEFEFT